MKNLISCVLVLVCSISTAAETRDPFPEPIVADRDVIVVGIEVFTALPDIGGAPAQMKTAIGEPGSGRLLVSDMAGVIYRIDTDGSASVYLDIRDARWGVAVDAAWREQGLQSFALHPQFAEANTAGYGKIYTWLDAVRQDSPADFSTKSEQVTHHTVLLEWTARDIATASYDGAAPRELMRLQQPFRNHNGGAIAFNPTSAQGDADFGKLYIGVGDGGSGGDPLKVAQDQGSIFGKILRIDPMGRNSRNGKYGIPADNPFLNQARALPEIFAYGLRNPQQFAWDTDSGQMLTTDIGQGTVEEVSLVAAGDNLGWSDWEGSFRFVSGGSVDTQGARSDAKLRFPLVEFDHTDPLFMQNAAVTGLQVVRSDAITELQDLILFGELARGELLYVSADEHPDGGQAAIRRVLFDSGDGTPRTLLEIVQLNRTSQGKEPPLRTDMRIGMLGNGEIYLVNKYDGAVRRLKSLR